MYRVDPFTIITREAGAGGISLGIEGPSKAVIDFQDKRDGTSDVNYIVTQPGQYYSVLSTQYSILSVVPSLNLYLLSAYFLSVSTLSTQYVLLSIRLV